MRHRLLFASAGVIALLLVMSLIGDQATVRADSSSMNWDVSMTDAAPEGSGGGCDSDDDGVADVGECPVISSHLFIDTKDAASNESFFDLATQIWRTGPEGDDLDGDTIKEPANGVAHLSNQPHANAVGRITFSIKNNIKVPLLPTNLESTGQPPVCGSAGTGTFTPAPFYIWAASKDSTKLVSHRDLDADTVPETQENNYSLGDDCSQSGGTPDPYGIPDGVDCTPVPIPRIQTVIGLPLNKYVGRSYGIANLPIVPPLVFNPVDVNFLVYNMVGVAEVQGYVQYTVVLYPGEPAVNPFEYGYNVTTQTVDTCPPYFSSPVMVYGVSQPHAFSGGTPPWQVATPQRKVVADGGSYDFLLFKSVGEDWDGDTISDHYDHCAIDPASGAAAGDADFDGLTGLCETLGAGNGEGNNPDPHNTAPPWSFGQDVDQDGFLNSYDNCPIIADRDLDNADGDDDPSTGKDYQLDSDVDGVGDVCEIDLVGILPGLVAGAHLIPGNGQGYPGPQTGDMVQVRAPGIFVDRDNVCSDPFTPGVAELRDDAAEGRWCAAFDSVPAGKGISALGRVVADSNDDADPDLLDHPADGAIEWMDTNSDTDADGHTDACEAFMGSDPLDASSTPSNSPPAGDCDNDGTGDAAEEAAGTSPFTGLNPDADRDGCARSEELPGAASPKPGSTAAGGVSFQDSAWYDFYDVPVPSLKAGPGGTYNKSVTMGDVGAVLGYVGTTSTMPAYQTDNNSNTVLDGVEYDRSSSPPPNPPGDVGPPDGSITMGDVGAALAQVGLACALGAHF